MNRLACAHNSLSRSRPTAAPADQAAAFSRFGRGANEGYALLVLMIIVTVMLISLTSALPSIYQEAQRQRETETIFRGNQYARAIYLYYRKVGHYPTSVKDLLNTNGTRFLRRLYPDPLSPNGRWHFIHAAANGVILDSESDNPALTQPSSITQPGGLSGGVPAPATGPQPAGPTAAFGQAPLSGAPPAGQPSPFGQATSTGGKKKPRYPPPDCVAKNNNPFAGPAPQTGLVLGAFIVGVAPCSNHASIRAFNHHTRYNDWEFLGMKYAPYTLPKVQTLQPSSSFPSSMPGQPQPGAPASPQPGTQTSPGQNPGSGGTF